MKPKTMILMGLAITCCLGASYMTSRLLADRQVEEKETVEILVAKRNLNIGERLDKPEDLFEKKIIAKENEVPDSIRDYESLKGKILKQSRNKGDTISPNNMYGKGENLDIPDGHEAVGLKVNLETSVSGLATLPGSRVNLIWFQRGANNESSRVDVLLQDVFVLAADGKVERDGITAVAQVVTLALTPEQVVFVNLAKETGIVNLSLRKSGDRAIRPAPGISGEKLRAMVQGQKTSEPAEGGTNETPAKGIAKVEPTTPDVKPQVKVEPVNPQTVEQPKSPTFGLTIINGASQRYVEYDDRGRAVEESRPAPAPRAPQPPPPAPQPAPPQENPQQDT